MNASVERARATPFGRALTAALDAMADEGRRLAVWWRDDDAIEPTPALERLLAISEQHGVPVGLAIIPEGATPGLAERLARSPHAFAIQHGWSHRNHEPAGARAAELGAARPAEIVLAELAAGRAKLAGLFGPRFFPVLTPPWNRIAPTIADRRGAIGLPVLTTFGHRSVDDGIVDTHLDPIAWRTTRSYIGDEKAATIARQEIEARRDIPDAPFGLLTHHLAHDEAVWDFTEIAVAVLAAHPAVTWPAPATLFGTPPAA